jgi:hypothetical protein
MGKHVSKHMAVLYDWNTRGSIRTDWAAWLLIGTPKLPKANAANRAAAQPHASHDADDRDGDGEFMALSMRAVGRVNGKAVIDANNELMSFTYAAVRLQNQSAVRQELETAHVVEKNGEPDLHGHLNSCCHLESARSRA